MAKKKTDKKSTKKTAKKHNKKPPAKRKAKVKAKSKAKAKKKAPAKNKVGRPLKFKTVKTLQKQIDKYFDNCDKDGEPYAITGLALALDTSRKVLCEYEFKDEFSNAIKKAKTRVENYAEKKLYSHYTIGAIFHLKNFGWKDKVDVAHEGVVEIVRIIDDIPKDAK